VSFAHAIEFLIERQVIHGDEKLYWDAAREIRNIGSHPESRAVMPPAQTLKSLGRAAHDINLLFARAQRVSPWASGRT
jgi:hypothetical protein